MNRLTFITLILCFFLSLLSPVPQKDAILLNSDGSLINSELASNNSRSKDEVYQRDTVSESTVKAQEDNNQDINSRDTFIHSLLPKTPCRSDSSESTTKDT
ncbi:hypothetical protein HZS_6414, partial [Henneguya salminicola]